MRSGNDSDDLARRPTWVRTDLRRRWPRPRIRRRRCRRLPVFMHAEPVLMVLGLVDAIGDGMSTSVMLFITSRIFNFLSSPASRLIEHAESRLLGARQLGHGVPRCAGQRCTRMHPCQCRRRQFACARMLGARRSGMYRADNCGPCGGVVLGLGAHAGGSFTASRSSAGQEAAQRSFRCSWCLFSACTTCSTSLPWSRPRHSTSMTFSSVPWPFSAVRESISELRCPIG